MASMPLLWLWFPELQRRQASGLARALGKRNIVLEASATRVLGEEKTDVLGVPEILEQWWGLSLALDTIPHSCKLGWLSSNQFGVSCCCLESQWLLPGRPSSAGQGHAYLGAWR